MTAEWWRRLRHSRGFGVHSPLAYTLVKRVLRPSRDACYYGEEEIEASVGPGQPAARATLLLRLAAMLQPSIVWISAGLPQALKEALRLAGGIVRIMDGAAYPDNAPEADLIVADGRAADTVAALAGALSTAGSKKTAIAAFGVGRELLSSARKHLSEGVLLDGVDSFIFVPKSGMELQTYDVTRF